MKKIMLAMLGATGALSCTSVADEGTRCLDGGEERVITLENGQEMTGCPEDILDPELGAWSYAVHNHRTYNAAAQGDNACHGWAQGECEFYDHFSKGDTGWCTIVYPYIVWTKASGCRWWCGCSYLIN